MFDEQHFLDNLRAYVADRDHFAKAAQTGSAFSSGTTGIKAIGRFNDMINQHAQTMLTDLPAMNLHELTALDELVSSALAQYRMVHHK